MNNYRRIYLSTAANNFVGAMVILFYFAYVDIQTLHANIAFWRGSEADWSMFTIVMVIASGLVGLIAFRRGNRLLHLERRLAGGESLDIVPVTIRN